jgi:rod shape-determining protein MreD
MNIKVIFSFLCATLVTFFSSAILPQIKPQFFTPFLVISFFNLSFLSSLWLACLGGVIVDLFSSTHLGLHALIYTLCSALFYRQKKYFKDTPINIAIYATLISLANTFLNVILLFVFEKGISLSFIWFWTDFIGLSLLDGFYAFLLFALPIKGLEMLKKTKVVDEEPS